MDLNGLLGIAGLGITGAGTVVWWMFRSLHARVDATERDLAAYKLHVAEKYATTNELSKAIADLNETMRMLFQKIDGIRDMLDKKADRA
jgi:hypothetical protein